MIDEFMGTNFAPYEFSFFKTENGIQCVGDYYITWCKDLTKYINKKYVTNIFADHYIIDIRYRNYFFLNASTDTCLENDTITDIIEINDGVLLKNYKTMYNLVAFCNVLNETNVEFLNEDPIRIRCIYKFIDCPDYYLEIPLPKHSIMLLADYMAMISIKFIYLHEFGHLYNGHVSLNKILTKGNLNKLTMNIPNIDTGLTILDYKTMEMDADAFAITNLLEDIKFFWEKDKRFQLLCPKFDNLIYLMIFSINTLFLLVHDENTKVISSYHINQLNYIERFNMILGSLKANISVRHNTKISLPMLDNIINNAMLNSTLYYNTIHRKENEWFINNEHIDSSEKIQNEILSNWKYLRKQLSPLSRVELAD